MTDIQGAEMPAEPTGQPPNPRSISWLLPTLTGIAGLVLGAGVVGGVWGATSLSAVAAHQNMEAKAAAATAKAESARKTLLKDALAECGVPNSSDAQLADDGYTLTINGKGNDDFSGLNVDDEACLLNTLKAPSAVISHIDQTTSMDGRQTETWQGVTFSWSYHPDRGLDGVFTVQK